MKKQVLVRSEFQDWLETLPADHVFTRCDAAKCPLGQYLTAALGFFSAGVGPHVYWYRKTAADREYADILLPKWAHNFVLNFDNLEGWSQTPAAAREVLNAIPETK